jgi:ABC-type multidrug transport system fused ATPase/permease subunit
LTNILEAIPFWGMLLLTILSILIPIKIGERLGQRAVKKSGELHDAPIGSVVGAALGLLAFMLAFTFQITTNRFDTRKQLLLDEVGSIRDAYLRASLLPEPHRTATRNLLREYVDLRASVASRDGILHLAIPRSEELHRALWAHVEALAALDRSSEIYALFTSSVNDLISLHNRRVTVLLHYKIPPVILYVLYFIAFCAMVILGFQFGISGRGTMLVHASLALIFSAVIWLILALDRPEEGFLKVNQQPLLALERQIHEMPVTGRP